MAAGSTFQIAVVTPEAEMLDEAATAVVLPAHDGQIGILRNRAPLLCKLGAGVLRIDGPEGRKQLAVDGGFAEYADNVVTVLTQQAWTPEDLDATEVQQELDAAEQLPVTDDEAFEARQQAIVLAKTKAKLTRS